MDSLSRVSLHGAIVAFNDCRNDTLVNLVLLDPGIDSVENCFTRRVIHVKTM